MIASRKDPFKITEEPLVGTRARLTSFYFRQGGNIYALSYDKAGATAHTLIDAGDPRHRDRLLKVLTENNINPANIERIIITHRHVDHSGLADLLAEASGAKILLHPGFQSFIDGEMDSHERIWFGDFQAGKLKQYDISYMRANGLGPVSISGVNFPRLIEPIEIDKSARLHILGCPESPASHSPDQVIVLFSVRPDPFKPDFNGGYLPTDDVIFGGDLWLMNGPFHHLGLDDIPRLVRFRIRSGFMGRPRRNHREQDAEAKEALKRGFSLIRVKPGHGEEFLGSRIIPEGILADRDIMLELGYRNGTDQAVLQEDGLAEKIAGIKEQAYLHFTAEIALWSELGYSPAQIAGLLARIYREQSGGSKLVKNDRKQRRLRLKDNLVKLRDAGADVRLRQVAEAALAALKKKKDS